MNIPLHPVINLADKPVTSGPPGDLVRLGRVRPGTMVRLIGPVRSGPERTAAPTLFEPGNLTALVESVGDGRIRLVADQIRLTFDQHIAERILVEPLQTGAENPEPL